MPNIHYARTPEPSSQIPPVVVRGWLHVVGMTIGMGLLWGSILGSAFWLATNSLPKMYIGVCIGAFMSIFTFISQINRRMAELELERLRIRLGHQTAPIGGGDLSNEPILRLAPEPEIHAEPEPQLNFQAQPKSITSLFEAPQLEDPEIEEAEEAFEPEDVEQPNRNSGPHSRWSLIRKAFPIPSFNKSSESTLPKANRRKFTLR